MLRLNGGCHVVVCAPGGLKMNLAKSLNAGDEYVELSRTSPQAQFDKLKADNPYGFDIVVEATGSVKILEDAINYCRRGGKLVVYGVYSNKDRVSWPPSKICEFLHSHFILPWKIGLLTRHLQSGMKSRFLAVFQRHTNSRQPLTTSTQERSKLAVSLTRPSGSINGQNAWNR